MNISEILRKEFSLKNEQVENVIKLIDEGNTIPFIARYRKEMTGEMSDVILRQFNDRLTYLRNLQSRKEDVQRIIEEQGKLTEEIIKNLAKSNTLQEVEDIYAPFKQKKRTRATIAKEKGLENLALLILEKNIENIDSEAEKFIDEEKKVLSVEDALKGANDIIAEIISDNAEIRKHIRENALKYGVIVTKNTKDEKSVYDMYYDFSERVSNMASHRVLAINRGEKEEFLKVKLEIDNDRILKYIENQYINKNNLKNKAIIVSAVEDAYKRLIFPSIEREIRNHLTELAQERAISVFGENIKNLLLQPPLKGKVVMGFDPGYVNGCKIAVVDANGKFLDEAIVYPHKPQGKVEQSKKTLKKLIETYKIDVIAIGNGTASRESESLISDLIKEMNVKTQYIIVNEAGASIYSASELAAQEHPDIKVSIRGAI
ncbi:MAG: RNA-binding transcriptional accessory protein, partial [Clostridium sp.]|nr:RNA-binding transcriptional accessory protein [Clostridium sp.]